MIMDREFSGAYFMGSDLWERSYIPITKVDSLLIKKSGAEDWVVICVTGAEREYLFGTFKTMEKAQESCQILMSQISDYMRTLAKG